MNFNPIIVLFLTLESAIWNVEQLYFNPIIVLFLTKVRGFIWWGWFKFQSYYSLISNGIAAIKNFINKFQSYYSLISNGSFGGEFDVNDLNFNPIIVLFLTLVTPILIT